MTASGVVSIHATEGQDLGAYVRGLGRAARLAARALARADTATKNRALTAIADSLEASEAELLAANRADVQRAEGAGLEAAMVDRLVLNAARVAAMAAGVRQVAALPDPVGRIERMDRRPNGLQVGRMRVPLGVIGMIYESRPNVTADAAGLCLKSGNASILRGGSRGASTRTRRIAACIQAGLDRPRPCRTRPCRWWPPPTAPQCGRAATRRSHTST